MLVLKILAVAVLIAVLTNAVRAVDLTKIDRSLVKEPAYQSKSPKYCLLIFGPEAKTRIWLVQDGNHLYADRNGNGDLTEAGEMIVAEKNETAEEGEYSFKIGEVIDGACRHKELSVAASRINHLADQDEFVKTLLEKNPKARGYFIGLELDRPGWKGEQPGGRIQQRTFPVDVNGVLQFADRPQDAPIIHFGGPLHVAQFGRHQLMIGRETDMMLAVGCLGSGPGTTAYLDYGGIMPEGAYPLVSVIYPPKQFMDTPITEKYELKQRC